MGCYFLLQGIFMTQGSNLHLLHWQADSLPPSHQGSPTNSYIHVYISHHLIFFFKLTVVNKMCRNVILQHLMTENEEIMSLNLVKINKQKA